MTLLTSKEFPAQSMSVRTAKLFESDVQSVPFFYGHICAVDHATGSLSIMFWSNRCHSSISRFSDGRRNGSGSGRLVRAESPKSRSPPDWDLDCSVANPVGWWSRVSLLRAVQQSHGLGGLEHCPAGRWRNHQTQNEWLAATVVSTVIGR